MFVSLGSMDVRNTKIGMDVAFELGKSPNAYA